MFLFRPLRLFFQWLYHPLAFTYDLVAAAVSLGQWNDWTRAVLPFVQGVKILELGHGPGHLQAAMRARPGWTAGIDESPQMGRLAGRNLRRAGYVPSDLVRGLAQALPFASSSIDTVVSTFPSEYIFDAMTLAEVRRVLVSGGRLVTLPVAWPSNQLLSLLFKVTGEAPSEAMDQVKARASQPFLDAGYLVEILELNVKSGRLMIILATPKGIDR